MIKAEFKKSTIARVIMKICALLLMIGLTIVLTSSIFFGSKIIIQKSNYPFAVMVAFIVVFYIIIIWTIKWLIDRLYVITINEIDKTLYFKNLITRQFQVYDFNHFDSYIDVFYSTSAGRYKEIYLLKNNKAERVICGLYYDNIDQIMNALNPIKYDGLQKNSSTIQMQVLLNRSISMKKSL